MERLFTNPEWNKLADESRLHEPGVVEDQINRVIGRNEQPCAKSTGYQRLQQS